MIPNFRALDILQIITNMKHNSSISDICNNFHISVENSQLVQPLVLKLYNILLNKSFWMVKQFPGFLTKNLLWVVLNFTSPLLRGSIKLKKLNRKCQKKYSWNKTSPSNDTVTTEALALFLQYICQSMLCATLILRMIAQHCVAGPDTPNDSRLREPLVNGTVPMS